MCVYIHRLGLYIFLGQIQHSNLSYKLTNRMCFLLRHFLPLDVEFAHIFIFFKMYSKGYWKSIEEVLGRTQNTGASLLQMPQSICMARRARSVIQILQNIAHWSSSVRNFYQCCFHENLKQSACFVTVNVKTDM